MVVSDPPKKQGSFFVMTQDAVFEDQSPQPADDPDRVFLVVAFDLRVGESESGLFLDPDGRDGAGAALDEVAETEDAVICLDSPPLRQQDDTFHFVGGHSVDELVLKLLDVVVMLKNV